MMNRSNKAKEMSFARRHPAVELIERAMEGADRNVVCLLNEESRVFVVFKLFQEVWRRHRKAGKMVLLVDNERDKIVQQFLDATLHQSMLSATTYFEEKGTTNKRTGHLSSCKFDIIITKGKIFKDILQTGLMDLISINLIVFDKCHLVCYPDHPYTVVLRYLGGCKFDSRSKIIGVSSQIEQYQSCPQDLEIFLDALEKHFCCKVSISNGLLALNRFEEQVLDEIIYYTCARGDDDELICKLMEVLQSSVVFLKDIQGLESSGECIAFVKHIFAEFNQILLLFGPLPLSNAAGIALKELKRLEKKCSRESFDLLILQYCRTQMNFMMKLLAWAKFELSELNYPEMTRKLLHCVSEHLKPEDNESFNCVDTGCDKGIVSPSSQPEVNAGMSTTFLCLQQQQSLDPVAMATPQHNHTVLSQPMKLKWTRVKIHSNDPLCIVLVPSTIIAKVLNSLINKLADNRPDYSFFKSAFIDNKKAKQGLSLETEDNVMECIQDGSVNIVVTTFEVEHEINVRRCNILIRLGMPEDYNSFLDVKKKVKSAGAKAVFLLEEEDRSEAKARFEVFHKIERILFEKCHNTSRPSCHEIRQVFVDKPLESYKPSGEEGSRVDLFSSISLINSYCCKFPSCGVGSPIPICRTETAWTDYKVELVSTLYLPRNSPFYWPIRISSTLNRDELNTETLLKARRKSEMLVALKTCRQLHKAGELDEDLQPLFGFERFNLIAENEKCDSQVADNGMGMDGSVQRKRAYTRKFPSILENNFPVTDEPSYLYSITMELTKPWTFERAVRSQSIAQSSGTGYSLGILSRKTLPKLPAMVVFDRAGEVTATIRECKVNPFFPNCYQLALIQRFTGFIFKDIAKPGNASKKAFPKFDPSAATSGYFIVILKNSEIKMPSRANEPDQKEIAFDFMQSVERALGSFDNPTDPPPVGVEDMAKFTDAVVTGIHNDKRLRFYVVSICYDRSPVDPFPNPGAAATFAEYYHKKYGFEVCLNQPLLDVDHISSRLNFLVPRYQTIRGHNLSVPDKDSKRSQKAKVYILPELCSIHPLPGYLWRQLFVLPSVLYRMESLLLAEELRSFFARALGRGAVEWPNEVPLPILTMGDAVGEEISAQSYPFGKNPRENSHSDEVVPVPLTLQPTKFTSKESFRRHPVAVVRQDKMSPSHFTGTMELHRDFAEEEKIQQTDFKVMKSTENLSDAETGDTTVTSLKRRELCNRVTNIQIYEEDNVNLLSNGNSLMSRNKDKYNSIDEPGLPSCFVISKKKESNLSAAGQVCSQNRVDHDKPLDTKMNETPCIIWTDPCLYSLYRTCGPPSTLILRALSPSSTSDVYSLERLEMLGDSFIKYAVSASVFFQRPHENEGKLSFVRGLKVSNRQLFYLARKRGLSSYLFPEMFSILFNWLPPGFCYENSDNIEGASDDQLLLVPDKVSQELQEEDDEEGSLFLQGDFSEESGNPGGPAISEVHSPSIRLNPVLHHCCSDKAIADSLEALVGAFLLSLGLEGAWSFLEWLGMDLNKQEIRDAHSQGAPCGHDSYIIEKNEFDSTVSKQSTSKIPCSADQSSNESLPHLSRDLSYDRSSDTQMTPKDKAPENWCKDISETSCQGKNQSFPEMLHDHGTKGSLSNALKTSHEDISKSQPNFREADKFCVEAKSTILPLNSSCALASEFVAVEEALNYKFHNRLLLEQAFTHTSLPRDYNSVRSSYEQLEFLGDALLDFLITHYLYLYHRNMSPGDLTDLRSAVVNNFSFAALAVKLGFAKRLQSLSPPLFDVVNKFIEKLEEKEMKEQQGNYCQIYSSVFVLGVEDGGDFVEVEVPKVLGDLFEAVAGAVYVDCGEDVAKVWEIYLPILKPSIDYYSAHPPLSAVRELLEKKPNAAKFAPVERMVDGTFRSCLTVTGLGTFVGIGRNVRIAKSKAAQRALATLRKHQKAKQS